MVFASSSSVYGDQSTFPLREEFEPRPRSPYAATQLAGEGLVRSWWHSYGTRALSFRYFNVYGPGQDPKSEYAAVIPRFATACLSGRAPVVYGSGEQARDFTFVEDVVEANLLALGAPERAYGQVLNIGGGREPTTVNRLLELVSTYAEAEAEPPPARARRRHESKPAPKPVDPPPRDAEPAARPSELERLLAHVRRDPSDARALSRLVDRIESESHLIRDEKTRNRVQRLAAVGSVKVDLEALEHAVKAIESGR